MICPQCSSSDTRVIDSRGGKDGQSIRRRRECNACGARFTTVEEIIRDGISVIKRDGSVEDFDQNKLVGSLKKALEKRPVESERIHLMVNELVRSLDNEFESEIPSKAIAERVIAHLKHIDQIAYIRYACSYIPFEQSTAVEA
jgi:transcriptional repressor NrdR